MRPRRRCRRRTAPATGARPARTRRKLLALACPASLKSVLSAREAAAALAEGLRRGGAQADELPVADGGEGTAEVLGAGVAGIREVVDAFGRPREARVWRLGRRTVVESAEVLPYDPRRLEPEAASSRGLGELLAALDCEELVVCLGGTATLDAGAGLLSVLRRLPCPTTALWDTDATLLEAPRLYGPQKGLSPDQVPEWEARFAALEEVRGVAELPGSGAAGGLGAAFAALGARLVPGAAFVLDTLGFEPASYDPVVTGEGSVDATTRRGKAPGEVARRCEAAAVRCVVFGGCVVEPFPGVETVPLSADPARACDDLVALGEDLATRTPRPA